MAFDIDAALRYVVEREGSDLHVKVPAPPTARIDGELRPIGGTEPLTSEDTDAALEHILKDPALPEERAKEGEADFSYRNRLRERSRRIADVIGSFGLLSDWRSRGRLARIKLDRYLPPSLRQSHEPIPLRTRELGGRELWVRPGSTDPEMLLWDYAYGLHQPPEEIADEDLKGIVELGCNAGAGIASFAARYAGARVLGVEPNRENVALARRNIRAFGERCQVVQAAVWDSAAEVVIGGSSESDIAARPAREEDPSGARMQAMTVDDLLEERMPGTVDYIHLSMEGGEPRALSGAPRWPQRVRAIRVEVQPEQGFPLEQALEMVRALGYQTRVTWVLNTPCVFGLRA